MKHKQNTRRIGALARRKADVQRYEKRLATDKLLLTLYEKTYENEKELEKIILHKLKVAQKDVAILAERVGENVQM